MKNNSVLSACFQKGDFSEEWADPPNVKTEILSFLNSIYSGDIVREGFVPEKNVSVDFRGDFWHPDLSGENRVSKMLAARKRGVRLIIIGEWEWYTKKEICQSILSEALDIVEKTVYAQDCVVRRIPADDARVFLTVNHIHGFVEGDLYLGLSCRGELVQVIVVGPELRLATAKNVRVVGGFRELLSHVPDRCFPCVSHVDLSKFTGDAFFENGFTLDWTTPPRYDFFKRGVRVGREDVSQFLGDAFNPELSDDDNMARNGFVKIYDCGSLRVSLRSRNG